MLFFVSLLFLSFACIYFLCGIRFWIYKIEVMFLPKENCETLINHKNHFQLFQCYNFVNSLILAFFIWPGNSERSYMHTKEHFLKNSSVLCKSKVIQDTIFTSRSSEDVVMDSWLFPSTISMFTTASGRNP